MKFSTYIRKIRNERGLSQRDIELLSEKAISNAYVAQIEKGDLIPSPKKIRTLSQILKVNFLDLMVIAGHVNRFDLKEKSK